MGILAGTRNKEDKNLSKEDMKIAKFEILVENLMNGLRRGNCFNGDTINPFKVIFGKDVENEYVKIVISKFDEVIERRKKSLFGQGEGMLINEFGINGIKQIIDQCKKIDKLLSPNILFWSLFIISIDEDLFNDKLNIVADLAYLLGFSEDTLEEFITAIKNALQGEPINGISYKTEEAVSYFIDSYYYN